MENKTVNQGRQDIVRKSNELIRETRYTLSESEQKFIVYLISKVVREDTDFKEVKVRLKDYCEIAGIKYSGGQITRLKKTIKNVRDKSWWIPDGDGGEELFSWVNKANVKGETATLKLDDSLKPYLLELKKGFTEYSLINVLALSGKYSVRMYEILKSYAYQDKGNGYSLRVSLEEFRDLINCHKYPAYKEFTRRVLKPSIEEINKYTDIKVSYTNIRFGREVKEIEFLIKKTLGVENGALDVVMNQRERLGVSNDD